MSLRFPAYLEQGLLIRDVRKLSRKYMQTLWFKVDIVSILPTDLLYILPSLGLNVAYVRFNRLFKAIRMMEFFDRTDTKTNYPNLFRISKLILYILIIIHWNACIYFQVNITSS